MSSERPTVVIVGAGLAGLTCADRLASRVDVVVLEARDRVGGRCWSAHGWADDQVAEHGGELIEAGQDHVLAMVAELDLDLESREPASPAVGHAILGGREVPVEDIQGLGSVTARLADELRALPGVTVGLADDHARRLDEMTVQDWLDDRLDGGSGSLFGTALATMVALNLGFEPSQLSALSLHHMFVGLPEPGEGAAFAFGNELAAEGGVAEATPEVGELARAAITHTFHVRGGNDLIARRLAERLPPGSLHLEAPLVGLRRRGDGAYDVATRGSATVIRADRVVLANPLPTLRQVDLTGARLSERRHAAIESIGMGTGSKVLLQVTRQPSTVPAWPGFAFSDVPTVAVWDSSLGQPGNSGLLTLFGQGTLPATVTGGHGPVPDEVRRHALGVLDAVSPHLRAHLGDRGWLDAWPDDPWAMGSYSGYGPGQYTRFSGFVAQPEGGVHFAGEHTSLSSPGYLDGAIASGARAAREVLSSLGLVR